MLRRFLWESRSRDTFIDIGPLEGPTHVSEHCESGCVNALIGEMVSNLTMKSLTSKFAPLGIENIRVYLMRRTLCGRLNQFR